MRLRCRLKITGYVHLGSRYILRQRSRPVINVGGRRCRAAGECGCCDMSIFLNLHTRLLSAQLQLQWSVELTINVYPPCHQSGRRRVLTALITTADDAGHPTSAALITGRQGRRSIYRDRCISGKHLSCKDGAKVDAGCWHCKGEQQRVKSRSHYVRCHTALYGYTSNQTGVKLWRRSHYAGIICRRFDVMAEALSSISAAFLPYSAGELGQGWWNLAVLHVYFMGVGQLVWSRILNFGLCATQGHPNIAGL